MNMIELIEEYDRHPMDTKDIHLLLGVAAVVVLETITCALLMGSDEYQRRHPPVVRVELTPQSTLNLAAVLADIQGDRGLGLVDLDAAVH